MDKKKDIIGLIIGYIGAMIGLCVVAYVLNPALMLFPLIPRMILLIVFYWAIAVIPIIVMILQGDRLSDYGFSREKVGKQIVVGILVGLALSVVLTLIPHLAGFGAFIGGGKNYKYWWQFTYEFFYCTIGIAAVEESVFRGFIYGKLLRISGRVWVALVVSSVLFGFFHILGFNPIQIVLTGLIGAFLCFCRLKIKNCTTLSVIIAHGIYDALIVLMAAIFLG